LSRKCVSGMTLMLLLTIVSSLASVIRPVEVEHAIIIVPDDYSTIQEAINAANSGDTIFVRAGMYYEHVVVNKAVSLIGESREKTIIDGNGTGTILTVEASNLIIEGFTIRNGEHGIEICSSSNNSISGNNIANNDYGILLTSGPWETTYSSNNSIFENNITNSWHGIQLIYSSNNSISRNNIINSWHGIWLHHSSNNRISANTFFNAGLYVSDSYGNVVLDNLVNGKPLVYLENVSNLVVGDAGQVILVNCRTISVEGLNLSNTTVGIQLWNTNNTKISENNITTNNHYGIEICSSSNNSISRNNIVNNWCGIGVRSSSNNSISGNNIANNGYDGIWLGKSSNNTIIRNAFVSDGLTVWHSYFNFVKNNTVNGKPLVYLENAENYSVDDTGQVILVRCENIRVENLNVSKTDIGVQLFETENSVIYGNNITENGEGIRLHSSSNNTIVGNNIANNRYGIWLANSSYNSIYHNNFIGNIRQVYDWSWDNPPGVPPSINGWDDCYPSGGNYWNDYDGTDLFYGSYQNETGSDGIGDTYYVIDANNNDRYPLMGPFGGLTNEGQNVTVYPSSNVCLIFENVSVGGFTTVDVSTIGPEPPGGFKLAGNYYDIKTTANISGKIKIRIVYDDTNMTSDEKDSLCLMQWNETSQQWIDITTHLDTENNFICGETLHLSIFAILTSLPSLLHDIAITNLTFSKTPAINETVHIYVTIENRGNFTETFTIYLNYTRVFDSQIGNQTVTLAPGESIILNFTWTPTISGRYEIKAYTSSIPNDINSENNTKTSYLYVTSGSGGGGGGRKLICLY